ncbi:MAG: hypothetical protein CMK59_09835 [Proteobacteria bacterium]|nr:hypothetical protein [Pseudomonadota bacterium]
MTAMQPSDNFAVILNANAGRVTPQLIYQLESYIPKGRLFLTQSQLHARDVVHACAHSGVDSIFAGGGDGTIVDTINSLYELRNELPQLPKVGALRLGTGNALSHWLNNPDPKEALRRWKSKTPHLLRTLRMVEAEETLFPFAGLGVDAAILNDYNKVKRKGKNSWYESASKGVCGYLLAAYTRTIPAYLKRSRTEVRIINIGAPAYRIGPNGEEIGPAIQNGDTLYEGMCSMVGCANTPYYGYAFKMFPFASSLQQRFQLRIIDMNALQMSYNVFPAWTGGLRHPKLHDFYADRVRVIFKDDMPYQLGGEAAGYRKELTFSIAEQPIDMIAQA